MTFAWEPRRLASVEAFMMYLSGLPAPDWMDGVVLHHTWQPVPSNWRGLPSMESLGRFYRDVRGWDAGPHLFLCVGSPSPTNDGIFFGTPLTTKGIHAGVCNSDSLGIEIVGNFDDAPWPADLAELVYGVTVAALRWCGGTRVRGHRECLKNKSCPGNAINMDAVRAEVARRLAIPPAPGLDYLSIWGDKSPYTSRAHWSIPSAWRTRAEQLGAARGLPMNGSDGLVAQSFEGGIVVYRNGVAQALVQEDVQ